MSEGCGKVELGCRKFIKDEVKMAYRSKMIDVGLITAIELQFSQ
jgi:hypothetical protein